VELKFLQTTPSSNPDVPFQPGQIIHVPKLLPEMRRWIRDGFAVLVTPELEAATIEPMERAVEPRPKKRPV
jgi:hypothetical protein